MDAEPPLILRPSEVARFLGISLPTLYVWIGQPELNFPRRIQLGPNVVGWMREEIVQWVLERKEMS